MICSTARRLGGTCLAAASLLARPALAADPQTYTVSILPTGNAALDAALASSSQLLALRTRAPAGPFALVARARQDVGRLTTAAESFGYYQSHVAVTVAGQGLDDPGLTGQLERLPQGSQAAIALAVEKGPLFHLGRVAVQGKLPVSAAGKFDLRPGEPAVAADVLAASGRVLSALQESGYALARVDPPVATLVPAEHALDVVLPVAPGPRLDIGPIRITGLKRVNERFVRRRLLIHSGELYSPSRIDAARQDLAGVGVFSDVRVGLGAAAGPDGRIPLQIGLTERPRHAVSFDAAFSTDLGGSLGGTWSHRNLFGNAEQLNLTAQATGLGGSASKGLGYNGQVQFLKPDYYHRDQTLELDLGAIKQSLTAYDQTAATIGATLTRKLSARWSVSLGLSGIQEKILQQGTTRIYTLAALPMTARFDSTALPSPLEDPSHGVRATLAVSPTQSLSSRSATFFVLQGTAATYFDLARLGFGRPGTSVLAWRGLVGSAQGATGFDLPPDQRFYGGGSATVRGYRYQSIGPLFPNGDPEGGAAIDAATIELRQRVWRAIGAVVFVDAGQVNAANAPFQGKLQLGAGIGARYYTPIGPVRVDVAVPLQHPPNSDSFELYLGLGQAF